MMFEKINIFNRLIVTWNLTKKKGGEGDRKKASNSEPLHGLRVLLFILSRQVYAAVFCFIFFAIKAILFKKK